MEQILKIEKLMCKLNINKNDSVETTAFLLAYLSTQIDQLTDRVKQLEDEQKRHIYRK